MKKFLWFFLLLATFALGQTESSDEILSKIDAYRVPYDEFLIRTKISTYEHDQLKETAIFDAYMHGNYKSLVIAREYKTRGLKLLYVNENLWVQLPASQRPIRITPIQRLMGEASNGDLARVSLASDYTAEIIASEKIAEMDCYKIKLLAKNKSATYHQILLYALKSNFRPLKAEYYVTSGKHIKSANFDQYQIMAGRMLLQQMTIFDELNKANLTIFEYLKIEKKTIPDKYFNKNYLIHVSDL